MMERRSWPWRKKTSEKIAVTTNSTGAASLANSAGHQEELDNSKNVKYVQISEETYAQLTEAEEQVKLLNEKLSSAYSEMTTKDNLVKQHAKVAEEAVSGWEKAEAEALALKHQLESVTLTKIAAEERAAHLDGALKECMRQIRLIREESEQKLHEVVLNKTKQWEKIMSEFQAKMADLEQELLRASAENNALERSFQERSAMLVKICEEKSQADADIEVLKTNIHSFEREISSLKYELHVVSKELEIRNEEKNIFMRSAEVANKHQLESVKKISKLEAECQRLRGLVRKKLPGPAALAQMKLEVENLGRDYGESRLRRSPIKNSSPQIAAATEFSIDNKETEFLTARLLAMEEETKMLKEALAKRNSELQASRNMCAKTVSRLHSLEAHVQVLNQTKSLQKSSVEMPIEGSLSQHASNPPSLTSMSEDGIDDEASCSGSWATALITELAHFKKEKNNDKGNKAEGSNELELMDDFLEMEQLACLSTETNGTVHLPENVNDRSMANGEPKLQAEIRPVLDPLANRVSPNEELSALQLGSNTSKVSLSKLQARIALIFESQAKGADAGKILEDIRYVVQDIKQDISPQDSVGCSFEATSSLDATCNQKGASLDRRKSMDSTMSSIPESKPCVSTNQNIESDLDNAISKIRGIVEALGKEAMEIQKDKYPDVDGLTQKIEEFSVSVNKFLCGQMGLVDLVLDLSFVLAEAAELCINVLSDKGNEGENSNVDCIDKVTLLENKVINHDASRERFSSESTLDSQSSSDPERLQEGTLDPGFEAKATLCKCLQEELAQLKLEKEKMAMDLDRYSKNLEKANAQLLETEQLLAELKLELAASQKSNSLAETQLKCMAESYKSLETRGQELETEINLMRSKAESLENELQDEKRTHQDALAKCKDLEEQFQRNAERTEKCSMCSLSSAADVDVKTKQEKDIAVAAEKLAECQETIFLLGRQLKSLRAPTESMGSPSPSPSPCNERNRANDDFLEDEPGSPDMQRAEIEKFASNAQRLGIEPPLHEYSTPLSPSDTEAPPSTRSPVRSKRQKHRPSKSSTSSTSSVPTPEKHSHGFSRFFSKGKSGH